MAFSVRITAAESAIFSWIRLFLPGCRRDTNELQRSRSLAAPPPAPSFFKRNTNRVPPPQAGAGPHIPDENKGVFRAEFSAAEGAFWLFSGFRCRSRGRISADGRVPAGYRRPFLFPNTISQILYLRKTYRNGAAALPGRPRNANQATDKERYP